MVPVQTSQHEAPVSDLASPKQVKGDGSWQNRVYAVLAFLIALTTAFGASLWELFSTCYRSDLNSYIVLIPAAALYLLWLERERLPRTYQPAIGLAMLPLLIGAAALLTVFWPQIWRHPLGINDRLALITTAYVCFLWSGTLLILGRQWMGAAAFPMFFLVFLIPLPEVVVECLENGLRAASVETADLLFAATGMPALRTGNVFQLPNISIEVAEECSGIHSSWILLITSLVAAHMFLSRRLSKAALVVAVIPLGILRNGFRIMVIGWLCVRFGPDMINTPIHRRGGPLFFALSLIPFGLVLWLLRRRELAARVPTVPDVI